MITIVVDAMGSDSYPTADVEGAVLAAKELQVQIILVGDEKIIAPELQKYDTDKLNIKVIHAPEQLSMNDKGMSLVLKARRPNSKNSMAVGIDLVKSGEASAFVTAGNTGAASVSAYFRLGMIPGIDRPALAPIFPTAKGSCIILDVGANPDVKPINLLQFAIMGKVYAEKVRKIINPTIGIISNGEEPGKGNQLVKDSYPLLMSSALNFVGNVEGKEVIGGEVDVAVTDGFTGNVMLKTSEAVAKLLIDKIKESIKSGGLLANIGGLLIKKSMRNIKKLMDPSEEGAAPLLGVNGLVFIGHGRSDATAIKNAIKNAKQACESDLLESIQVNLIASPDLNI
ncbi:phosphate acyltransferase PlsX [Chloroflexota bacterium]